MNNILYKIFLIKIIYATRLSKIDSKIARMGRITHIGGVVFKNHHQILRWIKIYTKYSLAVEFKVLVMNKVHPQSDLFIAMMFALDNYEMICASTLPIMSDLANKIYRLSRVVFNYRDQIKRWTEINTKDSLAVELKVLIMNRVHPKSDLYIAMKFAYENYDMVRITPLE